jgi:fructokinase
MHAAATQHGRPILFGEVLFDIFPDGKRILGGAPFNVAWHLQGFGLRPVLITRIGEDSAGDAVLSAMRNWDMDIRAVQIDPHRPTGQVNVALGDDQPTFDIAPDQAYDHITPPAGIPLSAHDVLYHGTLALRSEGSKSALCALREVFPGQIFVDVNLRAPWWQPDYVTKMLNGAQWAKLNSDELKQLAADSPDDLKAQHALRGVWVTEGASGARMSIDEQSLQAPSPPIRKFADSVGAGDAFSAICIAGILWDWPPQTTLARALEFASFICTQQGATAPDAHRYRTLMESWRG